MLNVYLAGEIHSNWRDEIIQITKDNELDVKFTSPVTDHDASDNCGVKILGNEWFRISGWLQAMTCK